MRATPESPRMFDSDFVDGFSRTPWWTVPLVWLPVSCIMLAYGLYAGVGVADAAGVWAVGWFGWTFSEYALHRWPFHWFPDSRMHFLLHGVHHKWVFDKYRLVMPPAAAIMFASLFAVLFYFLFGPVWMWPLFSGFIFGYMVYDLVHYATHHLKSKNAVFLKLKKHHLLHHHSPKHKDRKYGVSTTLWDHVFGTY